MATTIQIKRGLEANVTSLSLLAGEPAFTTDTGKLYIGKGGTDKILLNPTLGTAANANIGTAAGNVPVLGADGKLADSVLPKLAITDTFIVANQAAMLALTAEVGDVAVRVDENKTYILKSTPASTWTNWTQLLTPSAVIAAVTSVNTKTGAVVLASPDILMTGYVKGTSAAAIAATDTTSAAIGKLEYGKAPLASPTFTGNPVAPTAEAGTNTTQIATTAFVQNAISVIDGGTF